MTGVGVHVHDPTCAFLWGSWLAREARGRGLSRDMYEARIGWARAKGLARVVVSHLRSNIASTRANQHFGFRQAHSSRRTWPDGVVEDEVHYELEL